MVNLYTCRQCIHTHKKFLSQAWWHMLLVPALRRQRQVDLYEASLIYITSSKQAGAIGRPCVKEQNKTEKFFIIFILCVCFTCMYVSVPYVCSAHRVHEEGVRSPGTEIRDSC